MSRVYSIASESSLMIYFGSCINPQISLDVQKAYQAIKAASLEDVIEVIPSYASIMVTYNSLVREYQEMCEALETIIHHAKDLVMSESKIITIPTYYGVEVGLDLEVLSEEKQLSVEEIIALHTAQTYSVYAIGFAPGFGYLGEIDKRLETSRLSSPRKAVPKGSVSIADRQTAVYPTQSPGGWKVLGRTPVAMFDSAYEGLSLFRVGDHVRFESISKETFLAMGGLL